MLVQQLPLQLFSTQSVAPFCDPPVATWARASCHPKGQPSESGRSPGSIHGHFDHGTVQEASKFECWDVLCVWLRIYQVYKCWDNRQSIGIFCNTLQHLFCIVSFCETSCGHSIRILFQAYALTGNRNAMAQRELWQVKGIQRSLDLSPSADTSIPFTVWHRSVAKGGCPALVLVAWATTARVKISKLRGELEVNGSRVSCCRLISCWYHLDIIGTFKFDMLEFEHGWTSLEFLCTYMHLQDMFLVTELPVLCST